MSHPLVIAALWLVVGWLLRGVWDTEQRAHARRLTVNIVRRYPTTVAETRAAHMESESFISTESMN